MPSPNCTCITLLITSCSPLPIPHDTIHLERCPSPGDPLRSCSPTPMELAERRRPGGHGPQSHRRAHRDMGMSLGWRSGCPCQSRSHCSRTTAAVAAQSGQRDHSTCAGGVNRIGSGATGASPVRPSGGLVRIWGNDYCYRIATVYGPCSGSSVNQTHSHRCSKRYGLPRLLLWHNRPTQRCDDLAP